MTSTHKIDWRTFTLASGDAYTGNVLSWVGDTVTMGDYSVWYAHESEPVSFEDGSTVSFRTDADTAVTAH